MREEGEGKREVTDGGNEGGRKGKERGRGETKGY